MAVNEDTDRNANVDAYWPGSPRAVEQGPPDTRGPETEEPGAVDFVCRVMKARRKQLKISQSALSARSRLHRSYIGDLERGARNISVRNLLRMARALEIDPSEVMKCAEAMMVEGNQSKEPEPNLSDFPPEYSQVLDEKCFEEMICQVSRDRRRDLRMSQSELSRQCGLHRSYIGDLERGARNMSVHNMARIARALKVKTSDFLKAAEMLASREDGSGLWMSA